MNLGKKATLLSAFFTLLFSGAVAQVRIREKPCVEKARSETHWLQQNMVLTPEQYNEVKELDVRYCCLTDSIEHLKDKHEKNEQLEALKKKKNNAFKAVLTKQQYEQYLTHKQKKQTKIKSPFD